MVAAVLRVFLQAARDEPFAAFHVGYYLKLAEMERTPGRMSLRALSVGRNLVLLVIVIEFGGCGGRSELQKDEAIGIDTGGASGRLGSSSGGRVITGGVAGVGGARNTGGAITGGSMNTGGRKPTGGSVGLGGTYMSGAPSTGNVDQKPLTVMGTKLSVIVALPSCPYEFQPQH